MSRTRKPTVADIEAKAGRKDVLRGADGRNVRSDMHERTLINEHGKAALNKQLQPDLYQRISQVLTDHPGLLWTSESDFPITAYQGRVPEIQTEIGTGLYYTGWKKIDEQDAEDLLWAQLPGKEWGICLSEPTGIDKLVDLMDNYFCIGYKRPAPGEASTVDLVIGVVEGDVLTGISTRVIET